MLIVVLVMGTITAVTAAERITIASGNFTEPQIIAEAVKYLIEENTELEVEHVNNFSGSSLLHSAFINDDVQMYITYTGTQFTGVLGMEVTTDWKDRAKVQDYVQTQFDKQFDAYWFDAFGFNNTYAVVVQRKLAEKHKLTSISDLAAVADSMSIAMDNTFRERVGDGYDALIETYGFKFKRPVSMDYGLMYRAAAFGSVDAAVAYSTDGRIAAMDLVVLEDDCNFFPPYDGALVASNSILAEHPEMKEIVQPLIGNIDTVTMQYYNQLVDVDYMEICEAAKFLVEDIAQ